MKVCRLLPFLLLVSALSVVAQAPDADPPAPAVPPPGNSVTNDDQKREPRAAETLVVTATRSEREVSRLPVSATVVTEAEIRATPALSPDDLLRTIPGVHMPLSSSVSSTVQGQRISMRGLGGNARALVLVDGIPIHDPYYGTIEWQKVPLDQLRQIEVIRGANASLFGNFALGGTINMLTRPVSGDEVRIDASYGSNATQKQSLTVDHAFSAAGARLSHHRFSTNGTYRFPNPGPIDVHGWSDSAITSARVDFRPDERSTAFVKGSWSDIATSQGTALSDSTREIFDLAASIQHAAGKAGLISATLFHQDERLGVTSATTVGPRTSEFVSNDSDVDGKHSGGSLEYSTDLGGRISFLSMGVDLQDVRAEDDATAMNRTGAVVRRNIVTGHQRFLGLFAQSAWRPVERVEILASARIDHYKNDSAQDETVGTGTLFYPSTTSTQLDPRVSVRFEVVPRTALRASVYRGFKAPVLSDLYRTNQAATSVQLANPFLEPEKLVGGEIGIEWAGATTHLELTLYRNDIDGLQVRSPVAGQPGAFRNVNLGSARSQGVEAMAEVRLSRLWSVTAGYTFADSVITENPVDPTFEGNQTPDVARHIGTVEVRYRTERGTTMSLRGRVSGRSFGEPANVVAQPAHRIVDIGLSTPLRPWMDVYAQLENAFDDDYFYVVAATSFRNGQPRRFSSGVRLRLPAVPRRAGS